MGGPAGVARRRRGPPRGALSIVVALCCCVLAPTAEAGCTDPASVLDVVINTLREAYGTPRLQWSAYHASLAQPVADALAGNLYTKTCSIRATPSDGSDFTNQAAVSGVPGLFTPACIQLATLWLTGGQLYRYTDTPWIDNANTFDGVKAWVQLMWASQDSVGCATSTDLGGTCHVLVCKFGPATTFNRTDEALLANVRPPGGLPSPPGPPSAACADLGGIMTVQNTWRAQRGTPALAWNNTLGVLAQKRADNITGSRLRNCSWSSWDWRAGESLWSTEVSDGDTSVECLQADDDWDDAGQLYPYASRTPWDDMVQEGTYNVLRGFTQAVWRNSTSVACASSTATLGSSGSLCLVVACLYSQPGNTPRTNQAFLSNVARPTSPSSPPPSPPPPPPPPSQVLNSSGCGNPSDIVDTMNILRSIHYSPQLKWDETLAGLANARAQSILGNVGVACTLPSNTGMPNGVSVLLSTLKETDVCTFAAGVFAASGAGYVFSATPWADNSKILTNIRDFAQLIWANSSRVGCGAARASFAVSATDVSLCQVLICNYDPPGLQPQTDADWLANVQLPVDGATINTNAGNSSVCDGLGDVLSGTNLFRLSHASPPVSWNDTLSQIAKKRAEAWAASSPSCSIGASNMTIQGGESVYLEAWQVGLMPPDMRPPCLLAFASWATQESAYDFSTLQPWTYNAYRFSEWAAFSQMVWVSSRQVGCEAAMFALPSPAPTFAEVEGLNVSTACFAVVCAFQPVGNYPSTNEAFLFNVRPVLTSSALSLDVKNVVEEALLDQQGLSRRRRALLATPGSQLPSSASRQRDHRRRRRLAAHVGRRQPAAAGSARR